MHIPIVIDPDICHGKPTIAGTRTPVSVILGHLASGDAFETICREYDLTDADIQQAVSTATEIGDDRLQRQSRGVAVPDSFTHGSSQQRVQWLTTGLRSGLVKSCDTFAQTQ